MTDPGLVAEAEQRTASAMHKTAEQMELVENRLHRSAAQSPDPGSRARLHALGDEVTAQAAEVDQRADRLGSTE